MANHHKRKKKDRRRARKLADQAWDAVDRGELSRALKMIRRAAEQSPANPVLWNDLGLLSLEASDDSGAATAFAAAISVSPNFADAYAHLAAIRVRQGRIAEAVGLQTKAVELASGSETFREQLASYRQLLEAMPSLPDDESTVLSSHTQADEESLRKRCGSIAWRSCQEELTRDGVCVVPSFLSGEECAYFRAMFDEDERFAKTVAMNKPRFGQGVYRYFAAPLPSFIVALRHALYPHLSELVNEWQLALGAEERFPSIWSEFHARCVAAGQTTPTPLLIRYEAGGFNMPHRDLRGEVFFPIQVAVVLSSRLDSETSASDGFTGGEFVLCDEPERKESDRRRVLAGLGDAILFCTSSRLSHVGGTIGLRPVKHGVERVTSGVRYVLGVPFHEYE